MLHFFPYIHLFAGLDEISSHEGVPRRLGISDDAVASQKDLDSGMDVDTDAHVSVLLYDIVLGLDIGVKALHPVSLVVFNHIMVQLNTAADLDLHATRKAVAN